MKLAEVFRFEFEHQLRTPSTWVYAALLFGFAVANAIDVGPLDAIHANSPVQLAYDATLTGLIGLVVSAALFGGAALRDFESGMDPLLFTAPQRTIDHLGGRYLAALSTNALLLLVVPIGYALPTLIGYPEPAQFGPFRIAAVVQPLFILLLPNLALTGAVLFTVAVLSRNLMPVYITGFALFIGFLLLADRGLPLDPGAFGTLYNLRLQWTADEQNTRLVGSLAELWLNRLFWLTVTGGILVLLQKRFRFAHPDGGGAPRVGSEATDSVRAVPVRATAVTATFGFSTRARQTLAIARNSLSETTANLWFVGLLVVLTIWCAALVEKASERPLGVVTWPVTMVVTAALSRDFLAGIYVLMALYATAIVWKDRDVGVAEIADATPVADGTAFVGRYLALVAMGGMFLAASMVGGMLGQLGHDYYNLEPLLYLRVLFGMNLANIALVAMLVMTLHVIVNHKYLGLVAALMALVIPFTGPMFRHYLLVYAGDPGWRYSDLNGFGPFVGPYMWFKLYSAGWALLLAVVASALWVRGRESGAGSRLRQGRARFSGSLRQATAVAVALIVTVGGFIFYNTNVLNAFGKDDAPSALQANYEKSYGRFRSVPQPTIEHAKLRVEIYPDDPAVDVSGSFRIVNRTSTPIDSIHVSTNPDVDTRSISFDRDAKPVVTDTMVGFRVYALAQPLAPGDSMQMSFDVGFRQRGFPNSGMPTDVVENGTYFGRSWLPFVGYQPVRELSDAESRIRFGLPLRRSLSGHDVVATRERRYDVRGEDKVHVETTIGTAADQIAITSGTLQREWMENGRRYFQFETEVPQSFEAPIFSGRYTVRADRWNDSLAGTGSGVKLGVYHHAGHDRNLDSFVRSMKASLAYYTRHFGPYEGTELRIVEVPRYERVARSHPNIVAYSEGNFLARVNKGQPDNIFFATAYDIARQWWGGQVRGAIGVPGSQGFLSATLANYSALMVAEKTLGEEAARRIHASRMANYFTVRSSARGEVPLLEAADEPYLTEGKGLLAMYLMRDYLGEDAVNTALQRFIDKHRAGVPPFPTAHDVVNELRAVTPDSLQYLFTDLFETVTQWDVATERAIVQPTGTGEYRVMLDVVAKKVRSDVVGRQTEVPMDDLIDIGIFASAPGNALGVPLYLGKHRIQGGKQTISLTVPKEPASAGIDPYHKLIERFSGDNVKLVSGKTPVP